MRFIPQTLFDASLVEIRAGASRSAIADQIGIDCELMGRLLQLPTSKPVQAAAEFDLWASDRLQAQL